MKAVKAMGLRAAGSVLALGLVMSAAAAAEDGESAGKICLAAWNAVDPDGDGFSDAALASAGLAAARQCEAEGHRLGAVSVANMFYRLGNMEEAARAVQRAFASGRELGAAYLQRCLLETNKGASAEAAAFAACDEASRLEPEWASPYQSRGFIHYRSERYVEAEREWRAALARNPQSAPMRQNLGLALGAQNKHAEALDQHLEARRIAPRFPGPATNVGLTLEALGRQDEALKAFTQAARDIAHRDTLMALAAYHERRRQPDQAIEAYGRLLAKDPGNVAALRSRARLHEAAKRRGAARDDYARVAALEPKSLEAALDDLRATALAEKDRAKWAERFNKALAIAVEIDTEEADRQFLQGWARVGREARDWPWLEKVATRIIEDFPNEVIGFVQRGMARRELGNFRGAIEDETSALALEPKRTHSLFWRAQSYRGLGNFEAAEADFNRLLAIDPKYVWAWHNRGVARFELNRAEDSYRDFEQFLALYPGRVAMSWEYWAMAGRLAGVPEAKMRATLNARAPTPATDSVVQADEILSAESIEAFVEEQLKSSTYCEDCW